MPAQQLLPNPYLQDPSGLLSGIGTFFVDAGRAAAPATSALIRREKTHSAGTE